MVLRERKSKNNEQISGRKYSAAILMGILVLGMLLTGCTQSAGTGPVTTSVPATPPSSTGAMTIAATDTPEQVVTIIRYVSQIRDIKDSELLLALQVPVEWNGSTHRIDNPDNSGGIMYQTDLLGNDVFTIRTYSISNSQDQAFRDEFRHWIPAPDETVIRINEITYDRFESSARGNTRVAYVARKTSANERGYASVLFFAANNSRQFEKDDFENVVKSFRYFSGSDAKTLPGEEIPKFSSSGELMKSEQSLPVMDNTTGLCRCKLAG